MILSTIVTVWFFWATTDGYSRYMCCFHSPEVCEQVKATMEERYRKMNVAIETTPCRSMSKV